MWSKKNLTGNNVQTVSVTTHYFSHRLFLCCLCPYVCLDPSWIGGRDSQVFSNVFASMSGPSVTNVFSHNTTAEFFLAFGLHYTNTFKNEESKQYL